MSNVKLDIGGREFSVACAAGEEAHVTMLGQLIDDKLRDMGGAAGQGESRMLLFAALMLADENHELRNRDGTPEPNEDPKSAEDQGPALARLVGGIEDAAGTLEKLAETLEAAARKP